MISPEQLKKVAEYMGYEARIIDKGCPSENVYIKTKTKGEFHYLEYGIEYNPLQNSDQCLELMEKLLDSGHSICKLGNFYHVEFWQFDDCSMSMSAKTINEAVTLAAISYVEGLDD